MIEDFEALRMVIESGLRNLRNFEFTILNPLFWGIITLLFFILSRFWSSRSAFSFCLMAALLLLLTTEIEYRFKVAFTNAGEIFDPGIIRLMALVAIAGIFLSYEFLK